MTLYLYLNKTSIYIGQLNTAWVKDEIPSGTLIIFERKKYIVVDARKEAEPNTFTVSVNPV